MAKSYRIQCGDAGIECHKSDIDLACRPCQHTPLYACPDACIYRQFEHGITLHVTRITHIP
jgi:hypothetical protein